MKLEGVVRTAWSDESAVGALLRTALLPASGLFRVASRAHHGLYDVGVRRAARAAIPVVSVGNLRVGGTGKTPFTAWLVDRILELGLRPAVLHGGYGSDEPELHRRWHPDVPVFVGRDRVAGAAAAQRAGCSIAVLDDGFQHRRLARDLDIVLLAAEHGAERTRLLPRGPWREPLSALERAHVVVVTRKTATPERARVVGHRVERKVGSRSAMAWIRPAGWTTLENTAARAPAEPAFAVAAIAEPQSFFTTLEAQGVAIADRLAFSDHHVYGPSDLERIVRAADGRTIVTTAKDAVKLGGLAGRADVRVLEQRVILEAGEEELVERIRGIAS